MLFRVARLLGKSVFEIETTMSNRELGEWAEYLHLEPSNSVEIQLALLTTVASNIMGGKKGIDDFLITNYKPHIEKQLFASEDDVKNLFSLISK